jgi:hypothetical protein
MNWFFRRKRTVDNPEQMIQIFDDFSCKDAKTFEFNIKGLSVEDVSICIQKELQKKEKYNDMNDQELPNFDLFLMIKQKKGEGIIICRKLNFFEIPRNIFLEKEIRQEYNLIYNKSKKEFYENELNTEKKYENTKTQFFPQKSKKNLKNNGLAGLTILIFRFF